MMRLTGRNIIVAILGCGLLVTPAIARKKQPRHFREKDTQAASQKPQNINPLDRPLSPKQELKQEKELEKELKGPYKEWLDEDVVYIITPQERKAFLSLSNDEERNAFIQEFWRRRNPNPGDPENMARIQHYERIAYANEHFSDGKPGWETDRGHIYIEWGPPNSISRHPSGGFYRRPLYAGGGGTATYPFQVWHYNYLPGIGPNVNITFVDSCMCGDYQFTINPQKKDALLEVPGAGLTEWEGMNGGNKSDRIKGCNGVTYCGGGPVGEMAKMQEFQRLEMASKLFAPPPQQFKDLDAFITQHKVITGPILPFRVQTEFVRVTSNMDLVPVTLLFDNRDLTFVTRGGISTAHIDILGRFTTLSDRTVQTFEDRVGVQEPAELMQRKIQGKSIYWRAVALPPGLYRLDIVVKDMNNPTHMGIFGRGVNVPQYHNELLGTSSLILADLMHKVPLSDIGGGNFVIGDMYVRPKIAGGYAKPPVFQQDQPLDFWMQIYNLGINRATMSNNATVTYQITNAKNGDVLLTQQVQSSKVDPHSDELTLDKTLQIAGLPPGKYKVMVKVNDKVTKQDIAQSAPFIVEAPSAAE